MCHFPISIERVSLVKTRFINNRRPIHPEEGSHQWPLIKHCDIEQSQWHGIERWALCTGAPHAHPWAHQGEVVQIGFFTITGSEAYNAKTFHFCTFIFLGTFVSIIFCTCIWSFSRTGTWGFFGYERRIADKLQVLEDFVRLTDSPPMPK